ncbi:MAG: topoisomerase DNA-binding C4 zinc finger domain-containing protein [Proteobacteria bacterium]|nr:topoisomerase DNA-binding C4 zinc finger domain-containing protein [Pseudomonadota bacterium]MBU1686211.1 topoisomerase DNA-binding C4 zinc finger domain-containing protein [Pseudomonadota bacterium]
MNSNGKATGISGINTSEIYRTFDIRLQDHCLRLLGTPVGPGNLPLNYSNLTAAFLLYERDVAIKKVLSSLVWEIHLIMTVIGRALPARLTSFPGLSADGHFGETNGVKQAIESFQHESVRLTRINRQPLDSTLHGEWKLSKLIENAFSTRTLSPQQILDSLSILIEGVMIGEQRTKVVATSASLTEDDRKLLIEKIRHQIENELAGKYLTKQENDLLADFIYPLHPELTEVDLRSIVGPETCLFYGLIRRMAFAGQMREGRGESIVLTYMAGSAEIQVELRLIEDEGGAVYFSGASEALLVTGDQTLPEVGEQAVIEKITPSKVYTSVSRPYSIGSLLQDLKDLSVEIVPDGLVLLSELLKYKYITLDPAGVIQVQSVLASLVTVVNRAFPSMVGIQLSAYVAQTIEEVVSGRKDLAFALKQFDQTLMKQGRVLIKNGEGGSSVSRSTSRRVIKSGPVSQAVPIHSETFEAVSVVDEAKAEAVELIPEEEREGTDDGELIENSPEASVKEQLDQAIRLGDSKRDNGEGIGLPVEVGADASPPEDSENNHVPDDSVELSEPKESDQVITPSLVAEVSESSPLEAQPAVLTGPVEDETFDKISPSTSANVIGIMDCPLCGKGRIVGRMTPVGKVFYVCSEKPCDFMAWSKPYAVRCGLCESPYLVEHKSGQQVRIFKCPRAGCSFEMTSEEAVKQGGGPVGGAKIKVRRVARGSAGSTAGGKHKVRIIRRK